MPKSKRKMVCVEAPSVSKYTTDISHRGDEEINVPDIIPMRSYFIVDKKRAIK